MKEPDEQLQDYLDEMERDHERLEDVQRSLVDLSRFAVGVLAFYIFGILFFT